MTLPDSWGLYLLLGTFTGVFCGMLGIGGAVIIIPSLIFMFGFDQHSAQGTTAALFAMPFGILSAITYYKNGYVNLPIVMLLFSGSMIGGLFGAHLAVMIPARILQRIFGAALFLMSWRFLFAK